MARTSKSKSRAKPRAKPRAGSASADQPAGAEDGDSSGSRPREIRPYIYVGFDLLLLVVWALLLTMVMPNRHAGAQIMLWLMASLFAVMGGAMFARNRWGWRVGAVACGLLIASWIALVVVLLMTAGFLAGVYGGFGQMAAMGTIGAALMTLQLVALLPALQLKFLMTRAGRRHFGLEPLWRR